MFSGRIGYFRSTTYMMVEITDGMTEYGDDWTVWGATSIYSRYNQHITASTSWFIVELRYSHWAHIQTMYLNIYILYKATTWWAREKRKAPKKQLVMQFLLKMAKILRKQYSNIQRTNQDVHIAAAVDLVDQPLLQKIYQRTEQRWHRCWMHRNCMRLHSVELGVTLARLKQYSPQDRPN